MSRQRFFLTVIITSILGVGIIVGGVVWAATKPPTQQETTENSGPDKTDDEKTALEVAEIMSTWSPGEDVSKTQAELRAREYLTDDIVKRLEEYEGRGYGPGWHQAQEANATSVPHAQINPYTDSHENIISVEVTWDWVTPEGKTLPPDPDRRIYYFSFNDDGIIQDYSYEDLER